MSRNYQGLHGVLVNSVDLSDMRADQNAALPDTCTVLRGTVTATGSGGGTVSWGTVYTNVPCRMFFRWWEVNREEVAQYGGREASYQRYGLRVPIEFTVNEADRVVFKGKTYEVDLVTQDISWSCVNSVYINILSS